ncbi:MAG TPA: peptide-methionine (R)-S-oxide reductase MsrB [Rhizomicrobium sp.]|jgi:peptide-methionine (R)-S-oxide reductase|nr:peptide-methionine (R)-S-oxide reductase MsrB [Rhizomicrobium sp.]
MNSRRSFLLNSVTAAGAGIGAALLGIAPASAYEVTHTDDEWRKILSPEAYTVMRQGGTERAFTSPLNDEMRKGTYLCAGCALPLFSSGTKYHSGTGWPSFWRPLNNAVSTKADDSWIMTRTEVHCRRCGGHLGHVFNDGPQPTGLRYCMDGVALKFVPDKTA